MNDEEKIKEIKELVLNYKTELEYDGDKDDRGNIFIGEHNFRIVCDKLDSVIEILTRG